MLCRAASGRRSECGRTHAEEYARLRSAPPPYQSPPSFSFPPDEPQQRAGPVAGHEEKKDGAGFDGASGPRRDDEEGRNGSGAPAPDGNDDEDEVPAQCRPVNWEAGARGEIAPRNIADTGQLRSPGAAPRVIMSMVQGRQHVLFCSALGALLPEFTVFLNTTVRPARGWDKATTELAERDAEVLVGTRGMGRDGRAPVYHHPRCRSCRFRGCIKRSMRAASLNYAISAGYREAQPGGCCHHWWDEDWLSEDSGDASYPEESDGSQNRYDQHWSSDDDGDYNMGGGGQRG